MRKIIIVSTVIISSLTGTFCVSIRSQKAESAALKVSKTDFAVRTLNTAKSDLATAD